MSKCTFSLAWRGPCNADSVEHNRCHKHSTAVCSSCGAPATHECDETMGGFVCGSHLCDNCEHELDEKGTNGFHMKHCRKGEQKFLPWYHPDRPENALNPTPRKAQA